MSGDLFPVWLDEQGKPVACVEKIKVMNENLVEIQQLMQDAFEDAILMGVDPVQVRSYLNELVSKLNNPYLERS